MNEVTSLLARALDGEPPPELTTDDVLRAGRGRLRGRRIAAGGGVAAAVMAVALGAAALTGDGSGGPDPTQAAQPTLPPSTVDSAPPGPSLPLPPSTTADPRYVPHPSRATQLTKTITGAALLPGTINQDLVFQPYNFGYTAAVEVPAGGGRVNISIYQPGGQPPSSCLMPSPDAVCDTRVRDGLTVYVGIAGPGSVSARTVRPDGTWVAALAERTSPAVTVDALVELVTLPGLALR
ncbi:hypothetical protein EV193_103670 [Herbihabitans rhizosphaerae]|uniref:Uncharacterized protein n=1 Tax=Herbihabitans rhizosphaerae TaxID=1872711 RepID=A0A4Q7KXA1_9PSEU|nr:hypothetical protein [Herbihabitans rhizosphaerae]RZS41347.1 hypothetical protein EV193_103670 [Herbihabitans rhizosphaerae]